MAKLHFKSYQPKGVEITQIEYRQLRPDMYAKLFAEFKRQMLATISSPTEKAFAMEVESDISDQPVALKFAWQGPTAAYVAWAREVDGALKKLEGVTVLLTRLDRTGEAAVLEKIKSNPHMTAVDAAAYEDAANDPGPLAATFFATAEAVSDSLINALTQMTAAAFFDQFGMADPSRITKVKFEGLIAVPEGSGQLDLMELSIPDAEAQELFKTFDEVVKKGQGFVITMNIHGDDRPLTIRFNHIGHTAATFMLSYDVNNEPKHIHGLTTLLSKLDAEEDRQAIDHVRKFAALRGIRREAFDHALEVSYPVAASFFADIGSANYPPLHSVIRILSAAFFSQFGIGSESN